MSSKSLETFTFMVFFASTQNKTDQKAEAFEVIRSTIGNIEEFRNADIKIRARKIEVSADDYYFAFTTQNVFTMGFSTNDKYIGYLDGVFNRIFADFKEKTSGSAIWKNVVINFFAGSVFDLSKEIVSPLSKVVQRESLNDVFSAVWNFTPKKFAGTFRNSETGEDIEIMIEADEITKLHLSSYKDKKDFTKGMAKTVSTELDKLADKIIDRLR